MVDKKKNVAEEVQEKMIEEKIKFMNLSRLERRKQEQEYRHKHKFRPYSKVFLGLSRTKQCFKEEVNIKNIIARHRETGYWGSERTISTRQPLSGDFTSVQDYQDSQNIIAEVNEYFHNLPPYVRDKFQNNPSFFLDFVSRPENKEVSIELGILEKDPVPTKETASPLLPPQSKSETNSDKDVKPTKNAPQASNTAPAGGSDPIPGQIKIE